jgi:hypothetical protein
VHLAGTFQQRRVNLPSCLHLIRPHKERLIPCEYVEEQGLVGIVKRNVCLFIPEV